MNMLRQLGAFCACVIPLVCGNISHAATVQYTYSGNAFDLNDGTFPLCTLGDPACFSNITAIIELPALLGTSLSLHAVTPLAWSISDGLTTVTNLTADFALFSALQVGTDASGNISQWNFNIYRTSTQPLGELNEMRTTFGAGTGNQDYTRYCTDDSAGCYIAQALVTNNPGTWTVRTVPLPTAAWLFGSGLLGLLGIGRQRWRA